MKRVPWLLLGGLFLGTVLWLVGRLGPVASMLPACTFKRVTGFACATCGLTRCFLALGRGQWIEAIHWYPAAAGVALVWPLAAAWDLRRAWRGDAYPALPDSSKARLSVWALLAVVWVLQVARGM